MPIVFHTKTMCFCHLSVSNLCCKTVFPFTRRNCQHIWEGGGDVCTCLSTKLAENTRFNEWHTNWKEALSFVNGENQYIYWVDHSVNCVGNIYSTKKDENYERTDNNKVNLRSNWRCVIFIVILWKTTRFNSNSPPPPPYIATNDDIWI